MPTSAEKAHLYIYSYRQRRTYFIEKFTSLCSHIYPDIWFMWLFLDKSTHSVCYCTYNNNNKNTNAIECRSLHSLLETNKNKSVIMWTIFIFYFLLLIFCFILFFFKLFIKCNMNRFIDKCDLYWLESRRFYALLWCTDIIFFSAVVVEKWSMKIRQGTTTLQNKYYYSNSSIPSAYINVYYKLM